MTVRVYRWDDASAPVLTGAAGSYTFIDVLDKCLVAGYGSKTAAGWTKDYTGTGKATFKQGAGATNPMYLRVDCSTSSQTPRIRGYETMSDVDTGTGLFPTDAQLSGGCYAYVSGTADTVQRPWVVIADDRTFYMWVGYNVTTTTGLATTAYMPAYAFGDIDSFVAGDSYAKIIIGNTTGANTTNYFAGLGSTPQTAIGGHFMPRTYTQTGTSITCAKCTTDARANASSGIGYGVYVPSYPDPISGQLMLEKTYVFEAITPSVLRGTMRGLWCPIHNLPGSSGDTLTGAGALTGKTFLLLDVAYATTRCRAALETSDTW